MSRFVEIVKAHPLWIAGGVLGLVIIIWLLSGDSASEDAGKVGIINIGPTEATVMANRDLVLGQMALQAEGAKGQNAIELAKINSATLITLDEGYRYTTKQLADVESDNFEMMLSTTKAITEIQADRDINIVGKQVDGRVDLGNIAANAASQQAQIQTNAAASMQQANIAAAAAAKEQTLKTNFETQYGIEQRSVLLGQQRVNAGLAGPEETAALAAGYNLLKALDADRKAGNYGYGN